MVAFGCLLSIVFVQVATVRSQLASLQPRNIQIMQDIADINAKFEDLESRVMSEQNATVDWGMEDSNTCCEERLRAFGSIQDNRIQQLNVWITDQLNASMERLDRFAGIQTGSVLQLNSSIQQLTQQLQRINEVQESLNTSINGVSEHLMSQRARLSEFEGIHASELLLLNTSVKRVMDESSIHSRINSGQDNHLQELNASIDWITEQLISQSGISHHIYSSIGERISELEDLQDDKFQQLNSSVKQQLQQINGVQESLNISISEVSEHLMSQRARLSEFEGIHASELLLVNTSVKRVMNESSIHNSGQDNRLQELNASIDWITERLISQSGISYHIYSSIGERISELEDLQDDKLQQLNSSVNAVTEQFLQQLSVCRQINATFEGRLRDIGSVRDIEIQQLNMSILHIFVGLHAIHPATSCAALPPSSPSGYYWVVASDGSAVRVYCDMTRSCGGVTGGWMRVINLNMTYSSYQCPSGLRLRTDSNKRTCARNSDSAGCSSVTISTATVGVGYSRVCGRITGYQFGSTNGFTSYSSIDSSYVDGVSLTHGSHPRRHIWTFAARFSSCYCSTPRSFVQGHYFCGGYDSPLWDGGGCQPNNPPWFYRQLQPTTDDIEMRVCRDSTVINEDVAVEVVCLLLCVLVVVSKPIKKIFFGMCHFCPL